MRNHWTDKRALDKFIKTASEKLGQLIGADPERIRLAILDDLKTYPFDSDDLKMVRETEITDEIIIKMAEMIPDDVMKKIKSNDAGCGLWSYTTVFSQA